MSSCNDKSRTPCSNRGTVIGSKKAEGGCNGVPASGCRDSFRVQSLDIAAVTAASVKFGPKHAFIITHITDVASESDVHITDYKLKGRGVLPAPDTAKTAHVLQTRAIDFTVARLDAGINLFPSYLMPPDGIDEESGFTFEVYNGHATVVKDFDVYVHGYYA